MTISKWEGWCQFGICDTSSIEGPGKHPLSVLLWIPLIIYHTLLENGDIIANENGQFPCRFCGKTFSMKHVAKRHEKKLHIEKKEENLPIPKNLMGHFLDYETDVNESGRFPCTFCSKTFSLKHVAKRHEMSHTKEGWIRKISKFGFQIGHSN